MSCEAEKNIQLNAVGTVFRFTVTEDDAPVNLTNYTNVDFVFRKPDGTVVTKDALVENASLGLVSYTTVLNDLDKVGRWKLQILAVLPLWSTKSSVFSFWVHGNL